MKGSELAVFAFVGLLAMRKMAHGQFLPPASPKIRNWAMAIGHAEGVFQIGSVPQRSNNPGDIKEHGSIIVFDTIDDGWNRLYHQLQLIVDGQSAYYTLDMTFREMAGPYTGHDDQDAWAAIVAGDLGVSPDSVIRDWWDAA